MIDRFLRAAQAVAREARRGLVSLPSFKSENWFQFWDDSRAILDRAETLTTRLLRDAQLAGWIDAAENIFRRANVTPSPTGPVHISMFDHPLMTDPPVPLLNVRQGAANLLSLRAMTRDEFDHLDLDARRVSFTVARVAKEETVDAVRNVLADAVIKGQTWREARPILTTALNGAPLGPHHVEAIFRTHYGKAQTAGLVESLLNPMVKDEFPYLMWTAAHDSRTEETHREMEQAGLNGTAVYRADDPIWRYYLPPVRWNCRCAVVPLSIEDAAARGVKEAIEWERTGRPPVIPSYVHEIPLKWVKGWTPTGGRLLAA